MENGVSGDERKKCRKTELITRAVVHAIALSRTWNSVNRHVRSIRQDSKSMPEFCACDGAFVGRRHRFVFLVRALLFSGSEPVPDFLIRLVEKCATSERRRSLTKLVKTPNALQTASDAPHRYPNDLQCRLKMCDSPAFPFHFASFSLFIG